MRRKRYQEGGEIDDPEADEYAEQGALGYLNTMLEQQFATTPQGQELAREFLDDYRAKRSSDTSEVDLLQKLNDSAEKSRTILSAARERILANQFPSSMQWFNLAAALGRPTQTGQFGEELGSAAGSLGESTAARTAFTGKQNQELLGVDKDLASLDLDQIKNELAVRQISRKSDDETAQEALKILAKPPVGGGGVKVGDIIRARSTDPSKMAWDKVNQAFAGEYNSFVLQGGYADAQAQLKDLGQAVANLRQKDLTGPVVGTVNALPGVGDTLIDWFSPELSETRQKVQGAVLGTLRQIMGSQFTEKEGTRILENTFNPRLGSERVARRVEALMDKLQKALDEKVRAATWFEDRGDMRGYRGRFAFTADDFLESDEEPPSIRMPDGQIIPWDVEKLGPWNPAWGQPPTQQQRGGRIRLFGGGRARYAEGGRLIDPASLPPEVLERLTQNYPKPNALLEQLEEDAGFDPTEEMIGSVLGGGLGILGLEGGDRLRARPPRGERQVARAFRDDQVDPAAALAKMQSLRGQGVPAGITDVGGPRTRRLAEQAIIDSGPAGGEYLDEVEKIHEGSRGRVTERVESTLGGQGFFQAKVALKKQLRENARPLYKTAYEKYPGIREADVPAFSELMNTPDGKKAVAIAIRILRNEGKKIGREDAIGMVRKPSLEFLDYVKRGFDQLVETEEKLGPTTLGGSIRSLRNKLRDQLDAVAPEYKIARAQYAGDMEVIDALETGVNDWFRMQPEEVQEAVSKMSVAEQQAFRIGVTQRVVQTLNAPSNDLNAAARLVNSPATLARLRPLFPNPQEFEVFSEALRAEERLFREGKGTARRGERGRTSRISAERGPVMDFLDTFIGGRWSPVGAIMRVLSKKTHLTEKQANEVIRVLRTDDSQALKVLERRLQGQPLRVRGKHARTKAGLIGAGAGAATGYLTGED